MGIASVLPLPDPFDKQYRWLAENPRSGKHRPDIAEGYYCFPQGAYLIFYLIGTDAIDIIGVPHKHMDVPGYFGYTGS